MHSMKIFSKKTDKKIKKGKKNEDKLIIKCGKNDVRVYPKGTFVNLDLKREE